MGCIQKTTAAKLIFLVYLLVFCVATQAIGSSLQAAYDAYSAGEYATSIKLLKPLSEGGDAEAQAFLGLMYINGEGTPVDMEQAFYWLTKAAEQGSAEGQFRLGLMYFKGTGKSQSYKQALPWLTKAAEQGHAMAQTRLGGMYYNGLGVPKDDKQTIHWYTKAAEQGEVEAQIYLAVMYDNGEGVPEDDKQAVYWYTKAAEQGISSAQRYLARMYHNGLGVPKDNKQAIHWYTKAAEQGEVEAQDVLGQMYFIEGAFQDYEQSFYWFAKAAEQGSANSQFRLGMMYFKGTGKSQSYKQALPWLTKAAEQGHAMAQIWLGRMYFEGKGVPQNGSYGYVWFNLAASSGNEQAAQFRDLIAESFSPQQLAEAQELSVKIQREIDHQGQSSGSQSSQPKATAPDESKIKGSGTGFVITKDGYILTCQHVIDDAGTIRVGVGEDYYTAVTVREDKYNDLALLKISGTFPPLAFSSTRSAKVGQEVFTVGFPNPELQGNRPKLTKGSISSITGFQDDIRLYQISVPVQPGNSGGPLLDNNGNITGSIVSMLNAKTAFNVSGSLPQNVNYAVKGSYALALLDTLPEITDKLPLPTKEKSFDRVVERVMKSVVMIVAYE